MVSGSSFFKVVSHIYLNLLVGKFISTDLTTSSIFALPFIVKLKRMRASGLIEAFKILRTDSLQLSYTYLAADIFKPNNFVGKCRWIMSPLMGIFNHFLQHFFKIVSSVFCFTHVSVRSQIENDHRNFEKANLCTISIFYSLDVKEEHQLFYIHPNVANKCY